jgi:glycosyltransferase involved in cell wall biosynthesis
MEPIISVVIPLYNKEKSIYRTIRSVQNQTEQRFEIIVVNDGSTDNSVSVVQGLLDSGRIINQKNAGSSAARNRGVLEAQTDLIAFLDADDEWKPGFLSHILRLRNNFPDCGAYATFYENIQTNGRVSYLPLHEIPPEPWIGILPDFFQILQRYPFNSSSVAVPKKVFNDLGGFPVGVNRGEDSIMWIRLGANYPIAYSPSRQSIYHQDAENRVCEIFPSDGDEAKIQLMERMLQDNEVSVDLMNSFKDYYAFIHIHKAIDLIKEDHSKSARWFLSKVKDNYKHRNIWRRWYLLSLLPYPLFSFVRNIFSPRFS